MQRLEVSGAVQPIYGSLGVKRLIGALYVHRLWFYKHQHDNRIRSKLFVACQRWWFQWWFWFVPSVPGYLREEEEHKPDPWRNPIEKNKKKIIYSYLKCIVYDKLLKPWQSFWITLYYTCLNRSTDYYFFIFVVSMLRFRSHGYNYVTVISLNIGYILIHELGCLPVMLTNTYDL